MEWRAYLSAIERFSTQQTYFMSAATPHRIDPPNASVPRRVGQNVAGLERRIRAATGSREVLVSNDLGAESNTRSGPVREAGDIPSQDEWLRLHAIDLIGRLQDWSADLDSREAQLNSRTSIQEQRERSFRLRQQDLATELAEQQRSVERLRREIEAQARRLAFENDLG